MPGAESGTDLPMADAHGGRTDVVLPEPPAEASERLRSALRVEGEAGRRAVAEVAADFPAHHEAWARLARRARDPVERYAYARVGYHRGLDAMRQNGWGGTGLLRWEHPTNRGVLRCFAELRDVSEALGHDDEVERLDEFLHELDPDWDDANLEVT